MKKVKLYVIKSYCFPLQDDGVRWHARQQYWTGRAGWQHFWTREQTKATLLTMREVKELMGFFGAKRKEKFGVRPVLLLPRARRSRVTRHVARLLVLALVELLT